MSKGHRSIKKAANDNRSQIILPNLIDNKRNGCKKCAKRKTVCIIDKLQKKYSEDRENAKDTDGSVRALSQLLLDTVYHASLLKAMPRPTPGSYVFVKRSWRLPSQWFFPLIYYPPRMLGRFDAKIVLLPPDFRRRYRRHRRSNAATPATPRAPIQTPAAPPVKAIQPTSQTPGSPAVPLAARNQNNIPAAVGPPVIPVQQVGVPAAPSAPLPVPPVLQVPHGNPPAPAQNTIVAPAIPIQAISVSHTAIAQQGIQIPFPAAPIQLAAGNQLPPQAPQVAAQPEIDNEHPMYEPPFENDYYGHNGADPENEDLWAGVHIYGPGLYRLIDPKNPYLTKEQAQAAQKVWETVQAHMTAEAPQGNEVLLN